MVALAFLPLEWVLHPLSLLILLGGAAFSVSFLCEVLLPPPPPPLCGVVCLLLLCVVLLFLSRVGGAALGPHPVLLACVVFFRLLGVVLPFSFFSILNEKSLI